MDLMMGWYQVLYLYLFICTHRLSRVDRLLFLVVLPIFFFFFTLRISRKVFGFCYSERSILRQRRRIDVKGHALFPYT